MEDPPRCSAHTSAGAPCRRWPIAGGRVCATHGGRAPQVVARARLRLAEAADPAAVRLVELLDSEDEAAQYRAAVAILDRAGIPKTDRVELTGAEGGPVVVQATEIVAVITGVLHDLGVELDDRVRQVVARHLRGMSEATRAEPLRVVVPNGR